MRYNPSGELASGAEVTYTIKLENGPFDLGRVVVSNTIPHQTDLLVNSTTPPAPWSITVTGDTIQWVRDTLPMSATASLSYRVIRQTPTQTPSPTPVATTDTETPTASPTVTSEMPPTDITETSTTTPVAPTLTVTATPPTVTATVTATPTPQASPTGLLITKSGSLTATVGSDIVYVLRVTNQLDVPLTGLTIMDFVPVGVEIVDFGGGAATMPPTQIIQWQVPLLNPKNTVSRTFAVRLAASRAQVRNEVYFVDVVANGVLVMRAVGTQPVITTILQGSIDGKRWIVPSSDSPLDSIYNNGATVIWEYQDSKFNGTARSGGTKNPPFRQFFPIIAR